jgi:hypothetical protein
MTTAGTTKSRGVSGVRFDARRGVVRAITLLWFVGVLFPVLGLVVISVPSAGASTSSGRSRSPNMYRSSGIQARGDSAYVAHHGTSTLIDFCSPFHFRFGWRSG